MKAVKFAFVLVLCSVEARFLTAYKDFDSPDEFKVDADLEDQVDAELKPLSADDDDDDDDDDAKVVPEEYGATGVSVEGVHAPVGLIHAGPWNQSHDTVTVSAGFKCPYNNDNKYDSADDHPEVNTRCAELELRVNRVQDAEKKLFQNMKAQNHVVRTLRELDDENPEMVNKQAAAVSEGTDSPGLGSFLGNWWREMRMFAHPWYYQYLTKKQKKLEAKELELESTLREAKRGVAALKEKYAGEDEAQRSRQEVGEDKIEEVEDTTSAPEKEEPESKISSSPKIVNPLKRITTSSMMYALSLVVVLAAVAFFLSRKSSMR